MVVLPITNLSGDKIYVCMDCYDYYITTWATGSMQSAGILA